MLRQFKGKRIIRSFAVMLLALAMLVSGPMAAAGSFSAYAEDESFERFAGQTRYATSLAIADELKKELNVTKFDNIVVACGTNYPDALSGGYLASVKDAPLIIVNSTSETSVTTYIKNNLKSGGTVYILGGTLAISDKFEAGLKSAGINSKRLGGSTRYKTNILILKEARNELFTERDDLKDQIDADQEELDALNKRISTLSTDYDNAVKAEESARIKAEAADKAYKDAEAHLKAEGIDVDALEKNIADAQAKVDQATAVWKADKVAADKDVTVYKAIVAKPGWYFLNSKATISIETWRTKARNYSGTKSAANSSTFNQALDNAVSYDCLIIAANQVDKSNSVSGKSRKIDYNLMTAAAVSAAVYAANHSLAHTYAYKVIDPGYAGWSGENLAYGYSTSKVWDIWYYGEKSSNGPHFKQLNDSWGKQAYTGYGYTTKGSISPSHAQEFGTSASVSATPSQFRTDLANYKKNAEANYKNALAKQTELKAEPAALVQAKAELAEAWDAYEVIGEKYGYDLEALEKDVEDTAAAHNAAVEKTGKIKSELETSQARAQELEENISDNTDRFDEVCAEIAKTNAEDDELVVCSGTGYADSLSASAIRKPILLVGDTITAEQIKYIGRYDIDRLYVIGGTIAVKAAVETSIKKAYPELNVKRISGSTRYATSAAIADEFFRGTPKEVMLTYGMNFPDGLSGGPLAVAKRIPMLLVNGSAADAKNYVQKKGIKKVIALGGISIISDDEIIDILTAPEEEM